MDITSYVVSDDSPSPRPHGSLGMVSDGTVTLLQLHARI